MKLVTAIVQKYDLQNLLQAVVEAGFRATVIDSTGGFLRTGNSTIISAVEDHQVPRLLDIIAANCRERTEVVRPDLIGDQADWYPPRELEVLVGGASVFVLPVEYFERIV